MTIQPIRTALAATLKIAGLVGLLLITGCGRSGSGALLTEADLDAAEPAPPAEYRGSILTAGRATLTPVPIRAAAPAQPAEPPAVAAAPADPPPATTPAQPVLIDAKVGDINGRPVFAATFLDEAIGSRLARKAEEPGMTYAAWREFAQSLIRSQLDGLIADELIQAEGRASLKPAQKQGLRAVMDQIREDARRESGGSRVKLEQRLQTEQNKTVEQWLRDRESRALIEYEIDRKIRNRVLVSWTDIRLYYERNEKLFNPDPVARFRLIRVPTANAEAVESVRSALDRGEPFETVAAMDVNTARGDSNGLVTRQFSGEYRDTAFFGTVTELNEAARSLTTGTWTSQPVAYGGNTAWLYLESIERVNRPLSDVDVQLEILKTITDQRLQVQLDRYINRLRERASFSDVNEMTQRLIGIAEQRYWAPRPK